MPNSIIAELFGCLMTLNPGRVNDGVLHDLSVP